ncbi:MAG TPA: CoA ester lyase [Alphaproteobacteria bacterium]|nr:CoA ester lyase [Alphaproteobacteria bacterium]
MTATATSPLPASARRVPALRRSWLFVPGAERKSLLAAAKSGADVLIQELEDFTPPNRRPEARSIAGEIYAAWRAAGAVAAVRVNPLEGDGREDLVAVMRGRPDVVLLPKVATPRQIVALAEEVERLERALGIPPGATELAPNIESARGVIQAYAIATASPRVTGVLGSTEDMAADLGAIRSKDAVELAYVRQRLHVECVAAGVLSVDCPYTFTDLPGCEAEARAARRWGYAAKSAVDPSQIAIINQVMTPGRDEIREARAVVAAFEAARARGEDRARLGDRLIEVPFYRNAKRLLARAAALGVDDKAD